VLLYRIAVFKAVDERATTKGGGVVRTELWQDDTTMVIVKYAFAYVNCSLCAVDNGRVVGFDNAHCYPGHAVPITRIGWAL
jgi:hypothetical protein